MKRSYSQVAFFVAKVRGIYLASIKERSTIGYLFKHQFTRRPLKMKMKPEIDFRLSLSST